MYINECMKNLLFGHSTSCTALARERPGLQPVDSGAEKDLHFCSSVASLLCALGRTALPLRPSVVLFIEVEVKQFPS